MYCVRCGVRLQEGIDRCPLCETPVWNPNGSNHTEPVYPQERYPKRIERRRQAVAFIVTLFCCIVSCSIFLICKRLYPDLGWCGIAVGGIGTFYVLAILPIWFRKPNPVIFIPIGHAATAGYLLYLCEHFHGNWFVSFAMPVVAMSMIISTAFAALMKYVRGGRCFIFSGAFFLGGGMMMLTELFEHLTFGSAMFVWSPYAAGACTAIAIVLLLAGIIRPMREFLNRIFFI